MHLIVVCFMAIMRDLAYVFFRTQMTEVISLPLKTALTSSRSSSSSASALRRLPTSTPLQASSTSWKRFHRMLSALPATPLMVGGTRY